MTPTPGDRRRLFQGDPIEFRVASDAKGANPSNGWRAFLRTTLLQGDRLSAEIIAAHHERRPLRDLAWRDLPMTFEDSEWTLRLLLSEIGYFKAKTYLVDPNGRQHWPEGVDFGVSVHPSAYRTGSVIYCAWPRLFGKSIHETEARSHSLEQLRNPLDQSGHTVIPESGKLRDLKQRLPHIFERLGCTILHLLPVNPTPTTYARMGRFGSPYASLDLTSVDPALAEFDRRTTAVDQFQELTDEAHRLGGRVFIDLVINHTGWGSTWQETHPEWFVRNEDGSFHSPGAWGVVWEDLVEISFAGRDHWDAIAEVFLTWTRRGVDGFRCDAGYMIPMPVWRYVTTRVRQEFPDTIFLLEGLGGPWDITENLLTEGGMQWAYSELFQNYSSEEILDYMAYCIPQSQRAGTYAHYSETHDNLRLAEKGKAWSLLRNHICALASFEGAYGFTCGVEWLASEKINVHNVSGLRWDAEDNIVNELARLIQLIKSHPCFFDGATVEVRGTPENPIVQIHRRAADGTVRLLGAANTDTSRSNSFELPEEWMPKSGFLYDLLAHDANQAVTIKGPKARVELKPAQTRLFSDAPFDPQSSPETYNHQRARFSLACELIQKLHPSQPIFPESWSDIADWVQEDLIGFLEAIRNCSPETFDAPWLEPLRKSASEERYPQARIWRLRDRTRVFMIPGRHWLVIEDEVAFRAAVEAEPPFRPTPSHASIAIGDRQFVVIHWSEFQAFEHLWLTLERYTDSDRTVRSPLRTVANPPEFASPSVDALRALPQFSEPMALLTNGRGGMARIAVDLGAVYSKYDCLLGANLHKDLPVDRHVFAKRLRVWALANGFLSQLNLNSLESFSPGSPATWRFEAHAGAGGFTHIELRLEMEPMKNTVRASFERVDTNPETRDFEVSLTVRIDLEDRSFHQQTQRNAGAEHHFQSNCRRLKDHTGFKFAPDADRSVSVVLDRGLYHEAPEWSVGVPHPVEASRGQVGAGDCYSPGWFQIPLESGQSAALTLTADAENDPANESTEPKGASHLSRESEPDSFETTLREATQAFIVRRESGKTIIAGYPWFLDWGRDTLICARGLIAGNWLEETREVLKVYGKYESGGTLPNTIHGADLSNRNTSDAPLWFAIVLEELVACFGESLYEETVDASGKTLAQTLINIGEGYWNGLDNGVHADTKSGLIWSPAHFTWMDTNHPAGTPRNGYPIEIQVLWLRLLQHLENVTSASVSSTWKRRRELAEREFIHRFWLEDERYFADVLIADSKQSPSVATPSDALRPNQLFAVSLGVVNGEKARAAVNAAADWLIIPGAIRSLAPRPVKVPLPVFGADGRALNDPHAPFSGRYEGDEDTCRKPAYHNGTAWTWPFPVFCEALVKAWNESPIVVDAAKHYLSSSADLLTVGAIGQIPEIADGAYPHTPRGCDAQAWGATEALRVWKWLNTFELPDSESDSRNKRG